MNRSTEEKGQLLLRKLQLLNGDRMQEEKVPTEPPPSMDAKASGQHLGGKGMCAVSKCLP